MIKFRIYIQKVSIIADKSLAIWGRLAVNTPVSYYVHVVEKNEKAVTLVDTTTLQSCNSTSLALLLTTVVANYGEDQEDVIGLASDSAEYMRNLVNDLRSAHNS